MNSIYIFFNNMSILHLCTFKTPINSAFMSDKGKRYHALEKCEGVIVLLRFANMMAKQPNTI